MWVLKLDASKAYDRTSWALTLRKLYQTPELEAIYKYSQFTLGYDNFVSLRNPDGSYHLEQVRSGLTQGHVASSAFFADAAKLSFASILIVTLLIS
jgi:hypothetical protein